MNPNRPYSPDCVEWGFSEVELPLYGVLRRLMCNELYEQIRQVAQRSAERVVDLLCAGVGRDLGGQARQQPSQRLRTMTLQREEVLELAYDPFYDLALARGPAPIGLRPRPAGVVLRGGRNERSVKLHPQPLPLEPREALVGQVRSVAVGSEAMRASPMGLSSEAATASPKAVITPSGSTTRATLKPYTHSVLEALRPKLAWPAKSPLREALTLTMAGMRVVSITR